MLELITEQSFLLLVRVCSELWKERSSLWKEFCYHPHWRKPCSSSLPRYLSKCEAQSLSSTWFISYLRSAKLCAVSILEATWAAWTLFPANSHSSPDNVGTTKSSVNLIWTRKRRKKVGKIVLLNSVLCAGEQHILFSLVLDTDVGNWPVMSLSTQSSC